MTEDEAAELRASGYAPPPAYEPLHAGGFCAIVVAMVLVVFMWLARIDADRFLFVLVAAIALGFALPYLYFRAQRRVHSNAFNYELERIYREQRKAASRAEISN